MTWLNELSTVVMFVAFVAIVAWAWSSKRKTSFDEAARAPLEEDDGDDKAGQDAAARAEHRATAHNKADA
ncbi:MAG: cbb3-type cytochrome oxidase subunit 3 [Burkholderiales bacterium]